MSDYYVLVDSYQDDDGNLIDIYEHQETGTRIEKQVGDSDE